MIFSMSIIAGPSIFDYEMYHDITVTRKKKKVEVKPVPYDMNT